MDELRRGLIAYGVRLMVQATDADASSLVQDCLGEEAPQLHSTTFEHLLGTHEPSDGPLRAVLSLVHFDEQADAPFQAYYRPEVLTLSAEGGEPTEAPIFPRRSAKDAHRADLSPLWDKFADECRRALDGGEKDFLRFFYLMRKYGWALPSTYGEEGVSLFEQFKAVAALVFASGSLSQPAQDYLLIGGDIPGIQDFIYTITSKGAAKGLRGRSFFLQLLGDAVVRRLCDELNLASEVNVIYAAGGNFMLLAPVDAEDVVEAVRRDINRQLLAAFEGDLYLCLASEPLEARAIGTAAFSGEASRVLKQAIARQKRQRFREEIRDNWTQLLKPRGRGGTRYCAICQRELGEGEGMPIEEEVTPPQGPSLTCHHCAQFEELARDIAYDDLLLAVDLRPASEEGKPWQDTLFRLSGVWYEFLRQTDRRPAEPTIYAINQPDFIGLGADGFVFLGNTTPRQGHTIKTFGQMADDAAGIKRVGVLRMDVDDFGRAMVAGLERRTMALTSGMSFALELFFCGWLNMICEQVQRSQEMLPGSFERDAEALLYIIYAGGDDLFIVGSWDRLPPLAERIHHDFAAFTGHNPNLHISAGLTLERRKFPLYRAAERAHDALEDGAKEYTRPEGGNKDAVTFLGQTVGWEVFAPGRSAAEADRFSVKSSTRQLVALLDKGIPRSLLQVVQSIYGQYQRDRDRNLERRPTCEPGDQQLYFGRWMWLQAYQIERLRRRHKDSEKAIQQLQSELMDRHNVQCSGLAARWAEYLTRKE